MLRGDVVIALHTSLIARLGGASGIRDEGLLESAPARPRHRYAYDAPTLFDLAAAWVVSLAGREHGAGLTPFSRRRLTPESAGPPPAILKAKRSHTAKFLRAFLNGG